MGTPLTASTVRLEISPPISRVSPLPTVTVVLTLRLETMGAEKLTPDISCLRKSVTSWISWFTSMRILPD